MTEIQTDNTTKFYSRNAIGIATFFGGPLAAGFLIRQNFINLGKPEAGKYSLIIGIASTIILIVGLISLPEHILDKIPNALIPLAYTGIIYLILERLQGETLRTHKDNNGQFYSGWKAAGVGVISLALMVGGAFGYAYLAPADFDTDKYNNVIADFQDNEGKALTLYYLLEKGDIEQATEFIQETGIPTWQKNIQLVDELDNIEGLYQEYKDQNKVLREYCELRIEAYQLIEQAIREDTNLYDLQIEAINNRIDELFGNL